MGDAIDAIVVHRGEPMRRRAVDPAARSRVVRDGEQTEEGDDAPEGGREHDPRRPAHGLRLSAAGLGAAKLSAVLPPSSRGLGRRPLTAETGVRIPVAALANAAFQARFVVSRAVRATTRASDPETRSKRRWT